MVPAAFAPPCTTFQGPFQPTLPVIRSENDAHFRSDRSAGNKQMVPEELYLLVLERGLNLFCWFTFRFTPCNSVWVLLHSKGPKSPWNDRDFDWGILYDVNQKLPQTNEGDRKVSQCTVLLSEVLPSGTSKTLHFQIRDETLQLTFAF